jgi:adenosine deaminase
MFGCDRVGEYRVAHEVLGLSELVGLTRTAIDAAGCSAELRTALHAELAAVDVGTAG